ncbi:MAG: protein translocase subunit SecD, partial [Pseudomonadota bacterium]
FAIILDDTVLMAPRIREPIYGGKISMSGGFSVAEAERLERLMSSGDLMADVEILEEGAIGAE